MRWPTSLSLRLRAHGLVSIFGPLLDGGFSTRSLGVFLRIDFISRLVTGALNTVPAFQVFLATLRGVTWRGCVKAPPFLFIFCCSSGRVSH